MSFPPVARCTSRPFFARSDWGALSRAPNKAPGLSNTTGFSNSFFGNQASQFNTTGFFNSFFGVFAGQANTAGQSNSFFGFIAGP